MLGGCTPSNYYRLVRVGGALLQTIIDYSFNYYRLVRVGGCTPSNYCRLVRVGVVLLLTIIGGALLLTIID